MSEESLITIEVAYATPEKQIVHKIKIDKRITVIEAIIASGIRVDFPEIDLENCKVGIFSKLTKMDAILNDKDRIEIYRPLIADPKEVRRQRAAEGKKMKKGKS